METPRPTNSRISSSSNNNSGIPTTPRPRSLLLRQLHRLVDAGNTVVLVEHDLDTIASVDHVIDLGPGGGDEGGRVVATGTPMEVSRATGSATAPYLARRLDRRAVATPRS